MRTAVLIVFALAFAGCAVQDPAYIREGKEYGVTSGLFRDRWWNYYERGRSFEEGEFYSEAIYDLKAAIEQRSDDQWRARTYGMHFVNYFPHRELGSVYYKLKNYRDAEKELERSLETAESAKAKYFLNKTRKAILEESGADKFVPAITISHPAEGTVTNKFSITLKGRVSDDYFVSALGVNIIPLPLELSAKEVALEEQVPLKRGLNEIRIQASDLAGKTSEKILNINVDREGPIIIIEDHKVAGRKVTITGFLTDSTGIESFIINGQKTPVSYVQNKTQHRDNETSGLEAEFRREIILPEDTDHIIIEAEDPARNITKGTIRLSSDDAKPHVTAPDPMLNNMPLLASSSPDLTGLIDELYAFSPNDLLKIFDSVPPEIRLKDLADLQTVYADSLYLEGSVSDKSRIISLFINGESILRREGKEIFFNYLTRLKEGVNKFFIETKDAFGNSAQKVVSVNRKVPNIRKIGSRMSVSILPLESKGEQSVAGNSVFDNLIAAFVNQKRFQLVERQRMEEVLKELKLSSTELVDPGTASEIGRIVVADAMLTGTIYETKNSIEILTRLVDTETSNIMEAKDVFNEDKSMRGIKRLMEGLALKYKESFPLLEGIILKKDGRAVLIDLGSDKKIKKGMSLILFREGEDIRHPATGKVLGSEPEELGEAKVNRVHKEFSRAVIMKGKPARVVIKDKIITK